jgi:hypothetical protein
MGSILSKAALFFFFFRIDAASDGALQCMYLVVLDLYYSGESKTKCDKTELPLR